MGKHDKLSEKVKTEYEKVKTLKESEKGTVYLLRKKENRERAVFRSFSGNDSVYKNLMGVSCKNLPRIIAVDEIGDTTEVLEEYVFGDTLFEVLKGGLLSEKEAAEIAQQVCSGLSVMHEHRAIHRDIKPENVIIRGKEAVLIDFDASREYSEDKSSDTRILGTTGYASPEQYGLSQTDARSDIYSLGVMLNVMLTGEHPSTKLAEGRLGEIVQKCTMINPDSRYQSAEELKKALENAVKPKKRRSWVFALAALVLVFAAVFALSTEAAKTPPEEDEFNGNNSEEENFVVEKSEDTLSGENDDSFIHIENLGKASGKSSLLPDDFYDYWSADEIITEDIKVYFPGDLEKYVTYEFVEDVLTFTIGSVPAEEWKKAFESDYTSDYCLMAKIAIAAPNENVTEFVRTNGNGSTFSNLKRQYADGIELEFGSFNPEKDRDFTGYIFAEIIEDDGKFLAAPFERESIFYSVFLWKEADGTESWQIIPYQFVLGDDCTATFFESDREVAPFEELTEDDLWVNEFWQPVSDPERVVFRTLYDGLKNRDAEFMAESGVLLEIFEKPGYIRAELTDAAAEHMATLNKTEFYILPPDAVSRNEGESVDEWLDRVYAETKFVGYKMNASGIDKIHDEGTARSQWNIVEAEQFFDISDRRTVSQSLLPSGSARSGNKRMWYIGENGYCALLLINWYTEDPNENPDAEPAVCEYVYNRWEPAIIITENE